MLRISRLTDYATVLLATLAGEPQRVQTAAALSVQTGIAAPTVSKLMKQLHHAGLVTSTRGLHGGYQLARPAAQITFRDIIEAVEGPITLNICTDGSSSCALQPSCRMYRVWEKGQRVLLEVFSDTSLSEVASSKVPDSSLTVGTARSESAGKP